jgi:peptidoglycan/LPS O-acetylase OafA/YrhL
LENIISRENNFNIIRLLAALQVVFTHTLLHLEIRGNWLEYIGEKFIFYFPGVPIFFTVSGFLIYWSFENSNSNLKKYFINRFLRLYPALWVCLILLVALLIYDFPGDKLAFARSNALLIWLGLQASFFQFYTPDLLRFWGVHTPNGSLWTIVVEIQFYLIVPFLYFIINKFRQKIDYLPAILFTIFITLNLFVGSLNQDNTLVKIATVSVFPYLFYFYFGVIAYKYWNKLKFLFEGQFLLWFTLYVSYIVVFGNILGYSLKSYFIQNVFNLVTSLLLASLTLSAAFTKNSLSEKILRGNDISYGLYIYHMLVVNFFVQRYWVADNYYFFLVFLIVIILAWLSWRVIERKALMRKNKF